MKTHSPARDELTTAASSHRERHGELRELLYESVSATSDSLSRLPTLPAHAARWIFLALCGIFALALCRATVSG